MYLLLRTIKTEGRTEVIFGCESFPIVCTEYGKLTGILKFENDNKIEYSIVKEIDKKDYDDDGVPF